MIINIITLPQRKESIVAEMDKHGITAVYWDGYTDDIPKKNISRSHKRIVQFAKDNNFESVLIGEDDLRFTAPGAYQYFLDNTPEDYDIYLASYYTGKTDENFQIKNFRGLTLYRVHSRYYDRFLGCDDNRHIDGALSIQGGKFIVVDKFCAIQKPGYSFQRQRMVDDSDRLKNKIIFGV